MRVARRYRTTFVGREALVDELSARALGHAPLTLVGPAGVGKTRLAVEIGGRLARDGARGVDVPFVDLAQARTADDVASAWCATFGLPSTLDEDTPRGLARLARALDAAGATICIVDNCELLDEDGLRALATIIGQVARTSLLLTSRRPLGLPDEQTAVVPPLAFVGAERPSAAFRLLAERAGIEPDAWWSSADDRRAVEQILPRLDGLPLAIELAAWRLRVVAPGELAGRLDALLPLLVRTSDEREQPGTGGESDRHRSLTALLDASWSELEVADRVLLAVIAALPAGASLPELEHTRMASEPALLGVERLVSRSLLLAGERFRPYETVRAYVGTRAGELEALPAALSAVWRYLARTAAEAVRATTRDRGAAEASWIVDSRLNLERALGAFEAEEDTTALRALHLALSEAFLRTGYPADWPTRLERFCATHASADGQLATACAAAHRHTGRYDQALRWANQACEVTPPGADRARALIERSTTQLRFGDVAAVLDALDCADREAALEPTPALESELAWRRANVVVRTGSAEEAIALAERAVRIAVQARSPLMEGEAELIIGWVLFETGRPREAIGHYARSAALKDAAGESGAAAYAVVQVAIATLAAGDPVAALRTFEEGLARARRSGHLRAEALALAMRAVIRHTAGSLRDAETDYRDAFRFGLLANDAWLGPFFLTAYAAASAELGDEAVAEQRLLDAQREIDRLPPDSRLRQQGTLLVATSTGVLDVARIRRAREGGNRPSADPSEARARAALARCVAVIGEHPSGELTVMAAVLGNALAALDGSPDVLLVGPAGRWFRLASGETVDLTHKPILARLTRILAEAHVRGDRAPLPRPELVVRLWPEETMESRVAGNRLAVTISKLRALGLGEAVEVGRDGVRLRPELLVRAEGLSS